MLTVLQFAIVWLAVVIVVVAAVYGLMRRHETRLAERTRLDLLKGVVPPRKDA